MDSPTTSSRRAAKLESLERFKVLMRCGCSYHDVWRRCAPGQPLRRINREAEGQVNRLEPLKRSMDGQAKLDRLRRCSLLAG